MQNESMGQLGGDSSESQFMHVWQLSMGEDNQHAARKGKQDTRHDPGIALTALRSVDVDSSRRL